MSDTQKVVINTRHGGFGISEKAAEWLQEERGWTVTRFEDGYVANDDADLLDTIAGSDGWDVQAGDRYDVVGKRHDTDLRTDDDLIACVEELGDDANGKYADLDVIEIPAGVDFEIKEFDGAEWVAEKHRTWGK